VLRFVALAVPLLLLLFAGAAFTVDTLGLTPATIHLQGVDLVGGMVFGRLGVWVWLLEAVGLVVLFLLVQSRGNASPWFDGVVVGCLAWLFRGPLQILDVAMVARLPREPWWTLAEHRLVVYLLSGLLLAGLARAVGLRRAAT
jgi:hypothetical protein